MAGHFQTARGRFVVVNGYFPGASAINCCYPALISF